MMWVYSFSLGVSTAYLLSTALPIFLANFNVRYLPYAMVLAAVVQLGFGYITERLEKRIPRAQLSAFVLLAIVCLTLVSFGLFWVAVPLVSAFVLIVWTYVQRSLVQGEFWGVSALLFDVRESKRLFSLIDSGGVLAKILGYFSVPFLLPFLPLRDFLLFSAAGAIIAYFIVVRLRRRYRIALDYSSHTGLFHRHGLSLRAEAAGQIKIEAHRHGEAEESEQESSKDDRSSVLQEFIHFLRTPSYVRTIATVSFLAIIAIYTIDYGFLREINLKFAAQQRMASVLALFFGVAQVLCLLIKMGLAGRLFARFGPVRLSGVFPVILLSIGVLALFLQADLAWAIWLFTAQALFVELYSDAVQEPALAIAYQPIAAKHKNGARHMVDDVVEPLALCTVGFLLFGLSHVGSTILPALQILLVLTCVLWIGSQRRFLRTYHHAITASLKRKHRVSIQVADRSFTVADRSSTVADRSSTVADQSSTVADQSSTVADRSSTVADRSTTSGDAISSKVSLEDLESMLAAYFDPATPSAQLGAIEESILASHEQALPILESWMTDHPRWMIDHPRWIGNSSFSNTRRSAGRLARLPRVISQIHTPAAEKILEHFLEDGVTRLPALRELVRVGLRKPHPVRLDWLLAQELESSRDLLRLAQALQHSEDRPRSAARPRSTDRARSAAGSELLLRALSYEFFQLANRILYLIELRYDSRSETIDIQHIRDSLFAGDAHHRAGALEVLEVMLPRKLSVRVIAMLEQYEHVRNTSLVVHDQIVGDQIVGDQPEQGIANELARQIVRNEHHLFDPWTVSVAEYFITNRDSKDDRSSNPPMPVLFQRVQLLKMVDLFSETPDPVLGYIADVMEEVEHPAGRQFITKGELGSCLYIIVHGSVRVHDGDQVFATLRPYQVVGELALLDPEPRSASVTALEPTKLLRLGWEVFFDLMVEHAEIARGALATLARRIRAQNEALARAASSTTLATRSAAMDDRSSTVG